MPTLPMPPRQAAVIYPTVAKLRAEPGPAVEHYAVVLELGGAVFKSTTDPTYTALADDGRTLLIATGVGGVAAAWVRQRENDQGANIASNTSSLTVAGGRFRLIPVATLTGNLSIALSIVGATGPDYIEVTRLDVGAYTVTFTNGGTGGGTLATMPVSARARFVGWFDGVNWIHRDSHLLL